MRLIAPFVQPIVVSLAIFPFLAALITIPFAVANYRKYGGISGLNTLFFYSFILYMLCAFLLTVLPLPTREAVLARGPVHPTLIPFRNLISGLKDFGFDPAAPGTLFRASLWAKYLVSNQFFQIFANILMLIPEGIYLRYYFGCSFRKTALLAFLTSLFYELTQLTGFWGIYPCAFRCADVNDLMTNTLGGIIGYGITPLLVHFLPTKEELENFSRRKADHVSIIREGFAEVIDGIFLSTVIVIAYSTAPLLKGTPFEVNLGLRFMPICVILYHGVLQAVTRGSTLGKYLVRIRAVKAENGLPGPCFFRFLLRSIIIGVVYPLIASLDILFLAATAISFVADVGAALRILGVIGTAVSFALTFALLLHTYRKGKQLPHNYYARLQMRAEH